MSLLFLVPPRIALSPTTLVILFPLYSLYGPPKKVLVAWRLWHWPPLMPPPPCALHSGYFPSPLVPFPFRFFLTFVAFVDSPFPAAGAFCQVICETPPKRFLVDLLGNFCPPLTGFFFWDNGLFFFFFETRRAFSCHLR